MESSTEESEESFEVVKIGWDLLRKANLHEQKWSYVPDFDGKPENIRNEKGQCPLCAAIGVLYGIHETGDVMKAENRLREAGYGTVDIIVDEVGSEASEIIIAADYAHRTPENREKLLKILLNKETP